MSRSKVDMIMGTDDIDQIDVVTVTDAACLLLLSFYPISLRDIISTISTTISEPSSFDRPLRVYKLS